MFRRLGSLFTVATLLLAAPAGAQQMIDEPRLDPIFGKPRDRDYRAEEEEITNDDEFDEQSGWNPLRGFVGVLTFMAPKTTNLSIGVGPVVKPDYFGSDDYEIEPDPQAYVKFRNFVFLDDEGADLALFGFSRFAFGPSIRIVGDRDEDENPALQGLGDIGETFELGGFAATTFFDRMSVRFKIRKGISTGHRGLIVDANTTVMLARFGDFLSSTRTPLSCWRVSATSRFQRRRRQAGSATTTPTPISPLRPTSRRRQACLNMTPNAGFVISAGLSMATSIFGATGR